MCIDYFSCRTNLKLSDSALCQEISQTFLYVNVMFTIFISKKHNSEGKAWLSQNCVTSASLHGPGSGGQGALPSLWPGNSSMYLPI